MSAKTITAFIRGLISRILILLLAGNILLHGCATAPYAVQIPRLDTIPYSRSVGDIIVAADPYIQTARQKQVFNEELGKAKILPIQLLVRNTAKSNLILERDNISLQYNGKTIDRTPAAYVAVMYEPPGRVLCYATFPIVFIASALILGPLAILGVIPWSIPCSSGVHSRVFGDLELKMRGVLPPNHEASGFIYFSLPEEITDGEKIILNFKLVNEAGMETIIDIPLNAK